MNPANTIREALSGFQTCTEIDNGFVINTHCLYPNHSSVQVAVRGHADEFVVSDEGAAIREAETSGADLGRSLKRYEKFVKKQGLLLERGIIKTPAIDLQTVPLAILLVANSSKEVADYIFGTWRGIKTRDFKELVKELLQPSATYSPGNGTRN